MGFHAMCSAMKSCNRLFDEPCKPCDDILFEDTKNEFVQCQSSERNKSWDFALFSRDPYGLLKRTVRRIIGTGWGRNVDRRLRIPNQRGCYDCSTRKGGTLGAKPWESEYEKPGRIRSVVAKTKGKARVVTLQNSYVKQVLQPLHEGLYDSISRHDWLVRGELREEHLDPLVGDLKDGEYHISGDYSQATNLIDRRATLTVVEVLCESDHLTPEEKRVLFESFSNLEHVSCHGTSNFIRGQMMGSYLSFPILCILNRAMYLVAKNWYSRLTERKDEARPARFNGDDCAFNGTREFYDLWRCVTSFFGMVVNHEKTGLSRDVIELNSFTFYTKVRRFAPKPVLSFLSCKNDTLLLEALNSTKGLSFDTRAWIINHLILPEIRIRDVSPEALPLGVFRRLVKKAWFRKALDNECTREARTFEFDDRSGEFKKTTVRGISMVVGPCPTKENREWFDDCYRDIQREYLERWRGAEVNIPDRPWYSFPRQESSGRKVKIVERISLSKPKWAFIWPKSLLDFTLAREPWRIEGDGTEPVWEDDHPFLTTRRTLVREVQRKEFAPVLEGEWIREGSLYRWQGVVPAHPAR